MNFIRSIISNRSAISQFEELLLKGDEVIKGKQSLPDMVYAEPGRQDDQRVSKIVSGVSMITVLLFAIYVFSGGNFLPGPPISHKSKSDIIKHGWLVDTPGSKFKTVVLTPKAVERLGIKTMKVIEQNWVRTLGVSGTVLNSGGKWVLRIAISGKADRPISGATALISSQDGLNIDEPVALHPVTKRRTGEVRVGEYIDFSFKGVGQQVEAGSRLWVKIAVGEGEKMHKFIPYASVIYDARGKTWTYMSPKENRFVRTPIDIEFIDGDMAILRAGPPKGTVVATVGTLELYGAEHKIGL
ncbi:MAG: hypothetical protein L3J67_04335 [Hyphomicrobiaceae bacterium]|nr:hypothetical protein [Hyphomicrobiaceae bacterium]